MAEHEKLLKLRIEIVAAHRLRCSSPSRSNDSMYSVEVRESADRGKEIITRAASGPRVRMTLPQKSPCPPLPTVTKPTYVAVALYLSSYMRPERSYRKSCLTGGVSGTAVTTRTYRPLRHNSVGLQRPQTRFR